MFYTIFVWKILILFISVSMKPKFIHMISPQSHLCETKNMSCNKGYNEGCQMKYYKLNSTDCRDLKFSSNLSPYEEKLGDIQIQSYHYSLLSYKQTGFNVSFSNIKWDNMKFRFKQEGNDIKNTCREFHISSNSTLKYLFYDCLWSNESYEGKSFNFEYEASKNNLVSYKKYSFKVPFAKNIDETTDLVNWEIFLFTEMIKNSFGPTTFILHWQPLPAKFSINTYNITVFSNKSGLLEVSSFNIVTCNNSGDCKFYYDKWYGSVQFGVQPLPCNGCECIISKTNVFHLGGENNRPLLIGIVSITLIIPAFVFVLFLMRNCFISKAKKWMYPVPKLLVIFTPSISSHANVVLALIDYLKMYCNVEPLVDELHIFSSKSRDPFKWCNEAFQTANYVMVVASPYHKNLRISNSVYQNTDVLLLRLLREKLSSREKKINYFVLMLPYCSEEDIPNEAVNLRRYSFPKDINKMLKYIHKDKSLSCLSSDIQGGKNAYKLFGTKLKHCIIEAQAALINNKSEYDKMVREAQDEKGLNLYQPLLSLSPKTEKKEIYELKTPKNKNKVIKMAEEIFNEFPGRLDDLNLSGEEETSLMKQQKWSNVNSVINLDNLDL